MIQEYIIQNEEIKVTAINYGAAITGIYTKDKDGKFENIVCNYEDINDYINQPGPYLNEVVGPTAGRIAYGKCGTMNLSINSSPHHLHGGNKSISFQFFQCEQKEDRLIFTLLTNHVEDGYPQGDVLYKVTYQIKNNSLIIKHEATPKNEYPLYMTSHLYFNLSGNLKRDILSQELMIDSSKRVSIHPKGHPDKIQTIEKNSAFDFKTIRNIGDAFETGDKEFEWTRGFDCAYIFDNKDLRMYDPISKREMKITTTANSVVVYSSNYFDDSLQFKNNISGKPQLALALETQQIPNGINIENIDSNKYYHNYNQPFYQQTEYKFKVRED